MRWYSVKKYKPIHHCICTLVTLKNKKGISFLALAEYDFDKWVDWEHKEPIEFDGHKVTHFLIADPIEIEE